MDDRGDRVEEGERLLAHQLGDRIRKRRGGEGAGRHDHVVPVGGRQTRDLLAGERDQGMGFQGGSDGGREPVAVDRKRAAGRDLIGIGGAHHQGIELAHLLVQQPDRIVLGVIGAERIGANQLGQRRGLVRGRGAQRPHLVQHHRYAATDDLPGRLATREAAADDVNGCAGLQAHGAKLGPCPGSRNGRHDEADHQLDMLAPPKRSFQRGITSLLYTLSGILPASAVSTERVAQATPWRSSPPSV
jgi:hypothetical protein